MRMVEEGREKTNLMSTFCYAFFQEFDTAQSGGGARDKLWMMRDVHVICEAFVRWRPDLLAC